MVPGNKIVANTIITKHRNDHEDGDAGDAPQPLSAPVVITQKMMEVLTYDVMVNEVTDDDADDDVYDNVVTKHRKTKKEPKAVHGGHKHQEESSK